jgi:aminoglycoside phosphotransferase (APT) family kinase protein
MTALTLEELSGLAPRLAAGLGAAAVAIKRGVRIHGGASRETHSLDVEADGKMIGLILRRDPAASLIETERVLEFAAYRTFQDSAVPVPRAVLLEEDSSLLGSPFFVMQRIDGGAAASPFSYEPYGDHADAIGRAFFTYLGHIAARPLADAPIAKVVETPKPEDCWARELNHWARVLAEDSLTPQPTVEAAIRRLRKHPPPAPKRLSVVHGDYRTGNFLHDGAGRILAVLDWEMAHIGDAHEDLAWAMDPLWTCFRTDGSVGGTIHRDDAIRHWQGASGIAFDPAAYAWWSLFSNVKGMAIWLSAAKSFASGANVDPVMAFSGWYCTRRHEAIIARRLAAADVSTPLGPAP